MKGLQREEYLEPACIFCAPDEQAAKPVDLRRCLDRLDALLGRNDYDAARRHLDYWRAEALSLHDLRGLLTIENERVGLFRKLGDEAAAKEACDAALELIARTGLEGSVTAATTRLNVATARKRFGGPEEALPLYEAARRCYERELPPQDARLGGLYNNMALTLAELHRFAEARALYAQALEVMAAQPDGAPLELAVTELNLADLAAAERGLLEAEDEIEARLDRAWALLNRPDQPRNGEYAFVCEKCAPCFGWYGRFADAEELAARAKEIYERA